MTVDLKKPVALRCKAESMIRDSDLVQIFIRDGVLPRDGVRLTVDRSALVNVEPKPHTYKEGDWINYMLPSYGSDGKPSLLGRIIAIHGETIWVANNSLVSGHLIRFSDIVENNA